MSFFQWLIKTLPIFIFPPLHLPPPLFRHLRTTIKILLTTILWSKRPHHSFKFLYVFVTKDAAGTLSERFFVAALCRCILARVAPTSILALLYKFCSCLVLTFFVKFCCLSHSSVFPFHWGYPFLFFIFAPSSLFESWISIEGAFLLLLNSSR